MLPGLSDLRLPPNAGLDACPLNSLLLLLELSLPGEVK